MAGRRYNGRQLIVNDDMSYQESFFDKRDIKQLIQYDTARFYYPTPAERQANNLADKHYDDPSLWWIIAWFNQKPTEAHFKIGDVFYVPLDYRQVIEVFQKQNGDI